MNMSRRTFLKAVGGTLAGVAVVDAAGLALDVRPAYARGAEALRKEGKQVPSVCPYCAVGCGQIVTVDKAGQIIDIQGNPDSPINDGALCPKGAATYQLVVNDQRLKTVKYRAPNSDAWQEKPLDWAMDRIAELVKKTRDENFNETFDVGGKAKKVMNTLAIASLGGSTMDNEWNYIWGKLLRSLGVVWIENQARI